jgi:phosphoglycolate phosphatase-like HAD superfamily hydrolase
VIARFRGRAYAALILDCDGVILDSNDAKIAAFRTVAENAGFAPDEVAAFSAWQSSHFGLSRFRVLEALAGGTFGPNRQGVDASDMVARFAENARRALLAAPTTNGLTEFLAATEGVPRYVASGSAEAELREVFAERGLSRHFVSIHGSPTPKVDNVTAIVAETGGSAALFIGDAHADADAAAAAGIDFVWLRRYSTVVDSMQVRAGTEGFPVAADLAELTSQLQREEEMHELR